jgi:hypothetical protein
MEQHMTANLGPITAIALASAALFLGCREPLCTDADGDGFLAAVWLEGLCQAPLDCEDAAPSVHPGAVEVCGNGVDDDCVEGDRACRESTGGIKFEHIKTFLMITGVADEIDDGEVAWMAARLDLASGQIGSQDAWQVYSPETLRCSARPLENTWSFDHARVDQWGARTGRDSERVYLHYREDTLVPQSNTWVPGWNPKDDRGQCGGVARDWVNDMVANVDGTCTGLPSDPDRTASTGADARVPVWFADWYMPDVVGATWLAWATEDVIEWNGWQSPPFEIPGCIWLDGVLYYPWGLFALGKTSRYWNVPELLDDGSPNLDHPLVDDRPRAGFELAKRVSEALGTTVVAFPNVGAVWPHDQEPFRELFLQYYDGVFVESWGGRPGGPTFHSDYPASFETILEITVDRNKTRYLQYKTHLPEATDRMKLVALASYYLVNNANTYFSFNIYPSPDFPDRSTTHPKDIMWFPAIEHDVGQPVPNRLGLPDYRGELDSSEHYELAAGSDPDPQNSGQTYHVMAREYEHALVLVKFREQSGSAIGDATATFHDLPGDYRLLRADGALGAPISGLWLRNSEAAILIEVVAESEPPDPFES